MTVRGSTPSRVAVNHRRVAMPAYRIHSPGTGTDPVSSTSQRSTGTGAGAGYRCRSHQKRGFQLSETYADGAPEAPTGTRQRDWAAMQCVPARHIVRPHQNQRLLPLK